MKPWRRPPGLSKLLRQAALSGAKPTAFVLAGHNGSGKTTLWNERLAPQLKIPLVNADRITTSILPPANAATGLDRSLRAVARTWLEKVAGPL